MGLLAVLAAGCAIWAFATGKLQKPDSRQTVALAIGVVGLILLSRGKAIPALALIAAGAALWPWRRGPVTATMSPDEARGMLGVGADADAEAIRAAHRRLIAQTHPDRGGTQALASQINRARDVALSALGNKR